MSEFPYTDKQVAAVAACYRKAFDVNLPDLHAPKDDCYRDEARDLLTSLHGAGITVQFPEPRYRAVPLSPGSEDTDYIVQVLEGGYYRDVAVFTHRHPHAAGAAKDLADRLNRETS